MTIQKAGDGEFECMCDDCYSIMPETATSFSAMLQIVLRSNWVPEKNDATGEWTHRCPECIPKWHESPLARARRMFNG